MNQPYREYPKAMRHPQSSPAVLAKWDPQERDPNKQPQGKPARFPDVLVHTKDQEEEYAAKGYLPGGVSDPEAYRRAITGNEPPPESTFVEYPKYMYRKVGEKMEDRLVNSKAEESALSEEWYGSPTKAQEEKVSKKLEEEISSPPKKASRKRKAVPIA